MKQAWKVSLAVILVVALTACGSSGGGGTPSYAGQWSGTIVDSIVGSGTVTANLTQSGRDIGGTWQATYPDFTNGGRAVGVINGSDVLIELWPSEPTACPFLLTATRSGDSLSGTYAAFDCSISMSGQINLAKK